jgi:type II secretory pathway pseudopilin PulG
MQKSKGFTLVEAAIAIGVVAILSGIIIPLVLKNIRDAQMARARNDIQIIAAALATQLKDIGHGPMAGNGPGGCSGLGQRVWHSGGNAPMVVGAQAEIDTAANLYFNEPNTFANLFGAPSIQGNAETQAANRLFGFDPNAQVEHAYRGPYLGPTEAAKSDPWGTAYLILGYNKNSQEKDGPIWIVSAGPSRSIEAVNLITNESRFPGTWDHRGLSANNLAVRIH